VGAVASEVAAPGHTFTRVVFCCFSAESARHHCTAFTELGLV
jgi:hypothetical protein